MGAFGVVVRDPGKSGGQTLVVGPVPPAVGPLRQERMYGSRAIYKDGWWACARLDELPCDFSPVTLARFSPGSGYDPDQDVRPRPAA